MSLLRRAAERRTLAQFGDSSIPTNGSLAAPTASGVPVNDQTALQLVAVYACVRILATTLAGLPLNSMQSRQGIQIPASPTPTIVADPFGGAGTVRFPSRRAGFKQLAVSLLLRGNGYGLITARDYLYRPSRVAVLHPDQVKVELDGDGGRVYEVNRQPVDAVDMVHLTGMCMPGSPTGMSPVAYARQSIGLGLAAEQFGAAFFGQGAHLSGVIQVSSDLDRNRARQLKEAFEASHSGMRNAHAIGVLSGGAEWKPISISPDDAQFLGTRAGQNLDIAMLYGIPPHMLGQVDRTTSWGTGIEQQSIGFLTYTLADWIGTFEDAWTAMLPRGQAARFDTTALQRTDTAGRYASYVQARTAGLLTQNEIRARENEPPITGGDDINAPLNSAHTGDPEPAPDTGPPEPANWE
ncbi:phage portal protein [Streptomyces olivoreticuli]|uniref:phage portal protein n=1 Tax=Streptomyces olivoreticuli TaxID=68246 RepID=UPI00265B0DEF|nr:phage portal protein [Streptomyces olivoreticuli]WKK26560.1 phage portal protein [Streptomyces olivoreticuli]